MKITIAATKTNLLKAKKSLSLTREGYELLDEKRRILMAELTAIIDSVDTLQDQVDTALRQGYEFVNKAVVSMGRQRVEEISYAVSIKTEIGISQRRVMGVSLPVIALRLIEHPPYYSPHEVNLYVDESIVKFRSILELIGQLAEKKIALLRMAREAQKTIRKVNALEKVYLPYYKDTVKYISDRLDEESRDSFSMLKLIKKAQANQ
jgi:V/A-type H+-transporting ATPase subunit D